MLSSSFRKYALAAVLVVTSCRSFAQQADFNEVTRQMAIMLQNNHVAKLPFNEDLGRRFLTDYINTLDQGRLFFTQEDVDRFQGKYGSRLQEMILQRNSMQAATDIYRTFEERVTARVAQANQLLQENQFDFTQHEKVVVSRKEIPFPKTEKEAQETWRLQIKEAVLAENLRRETTAKLAAEQGKPDPNKGAREVKEKLALRYKRVLANVKDVDQEEISNLFLSSIARSCDPHSEYSSYTETIRFRDAMRNELIGIGAMLSSEEDGATKITGIVVGGPADREGTLKLNDRVVAVDRANTGKPEDMTDVMFMKIDKVVDLIRGQENTSVRLKVEPAGGPAGSTKMIVIAREKVELKDEQARGDLIEMKVPGGNVRKLGFLTLPSFYADFEKGTTRCSVDVERILDRMVDSKIDGLVIDLRGNGGGSLEEVRRMTGFFINRGPVVQVKNHLGQVQVQESENTRPIYNGPMVVITDKRSASASEILAGALQDYNRAVIIGESSTFGKGTVQQPMDIGRMLPLFSNRDRAGSLRVTIQKFYRPSGSSTQMDGVLSHIALPNLSDAFDIGEKFLNHALPHDRIRPSGDLKPLNSENLFLPKLKELSQARVKENKDFAYIADEVLKAKERIKNNVVSLNKAERLAELEEADKTQKARNAERKQRFAELSEEDKKKFTFYKMTLDELDKGTALPVYDPSAEQTSMKMAKDEESDLSDTLKWPTGLDPVKREALEITKDLIELSASAKIASSTGPKDLH